MSAGSSSRLTLIREKATVSSRSLIRPSISSICPRTLVSSCCTSSSSSTLAVCPNSSSSCSSLAVRFLSRDWLSTYSSVTSRLEDTSESTFVASSRRRPIVSSTCCAGTRTDMNARWSSCLLDWTTQPFIPSARAWTSCSAPARSPTVSPMSTVRTIIRVWTSGAAMAAGAGVGTAMDSVAAESTASALTADERLAGAAIGVSVAVEMGPAAPATPSARSAITSASSMYSSDSHAPS